MLLFASRVGMNKKIIQDGVNGFLANREEELSSEGCRNIVGPYHSRGSFGRCQTLCGMVVSKIVCILLWRFGDKGEGNYNCSA